MRKPIADKVLVLGIDGMDPRLTERFVKEGSMPNTKKFLEQGSARLDDARRAANRYAADVDHLGHWLLSNGAQCYLL